MIFVSNLVTIGSQLSQKYKDLLVIKLMNEWVITDKEASERYGYSPDWFRKMRSLKKGPPYLQMRGRGKVYYYVEKTDEWFRGNMVEK